MPGGLFPRMHSVVVHMVHQLASDIWKSQRPLALTQPVPPPPLHPHVCVCVLNCVCAPLSRCRWLRWPAGLRLCLKASSPKVIIKKSAIELLSQISVWRRVKMLRDWEDEPKKEGGINIGWKNISHLPPHSALAGHIFSASPLPLPQFL